MPSSVPWAVCSAGCSLASSATGRPPPIDSRPRCFSRLIGGVIGYFVVSVEAIRDRNPVRFVRLATYGALLGAIGGSLGMLIGDKVDLWLIERIGRADSGALPTLGTVFARGLG